LLLHSCDARSPRVVVAREQRLHGLDLASGLQQSDTPARPSRETAEPIAASRIFVAVGLFIIFVAPRLPPRCFDQRSVAARKLARCDSCCRKESQKHPAVGVEAGEVSVFFDILVFYLLVQFAAV
jgi:hypothetical protein